MMVWLQLAGPWSLAAIVMTLGWLWQRLRDNAGIVDVLWSVGVGGSAIVLATCGHGARVNRIALAALAGLWSARLAVHLWTRVRGEQEDGRYRSLRVRWKGSQLKFFLFFQFQAGLTVLFALPFLAVASNPVGWHWSIPAGIAIWLVSVVGESIADRQLARFRADPANRGGTCRQGLWRYSRHPNYFFEWLHWFSYVCLARGSPIAWLAWSGPLLMYVFLRWISGIPYAEMQALRSRGDDYRAYQRSTPMLFPWLPQKD
ncbi:MAG: putative rane protein [Gammaproteobacteria bacterium]|nr:putative rane protein [Gammaproteobacteria bacterium]